MMNIKIKIKDKRPENYLFFFVPLDAQNLSLGGDLLVDSEPAFVPGEVFIRRLGKAFSHRDFFMSLRALPEFEALARAGFGYIDLPRGRSDFGAGGLFSLEAHRDFIPAMLDAVQNQLRLKINPEEIYGISENVYVPMNARMEKAIQLYWQLKNKGNEDEN